MAIELPSNPDVLAERLALLEDPVLAEQLARENPSLFTAAPPQTEREVLAWTTRRFGTAIIAVTAAIAVAAGYVGSELKRSASAPQTATPQTAASPAAAAAAPLASQGKAAPPRRTAAAPRHAAAARHAAAPARHAAAASHQASVATYHASPVAHHAIPQPVVTQVTVAAPVPQPVRHHASAPAVVHHRAPATAPHTAPQSAADQLAAWSATHPASRTNPRTNPRSEPASSTETATSTATTNATAPSSGPGSYPTSPTPRDAGPPGGGTRQPPSNPNGGWTERIPGGILSGGMGPVIGVPRDSCTPRGGRTGIVMEAIQILAAGRH